MSHPQLDDHPTDPDLATLRRVAAGDAESFGVLVQRHQDRLFRLCERMLHHPEEAREATQEVFLKVFRNAAEFRPRGQVYTWVYRIAVNHCLNRLRRRKIARFFSFAEMTSPAQANEQDLPEMDPADDAPDAERRLRDRRRWQHVRGLIDQLPSSQRTVLVLVKLEGLSYRRAAEVLQITEGAVESRLVRAMRRLDQAQDFAG